MKKSLYYLAVASLMLVACDPVVDDADFSATTIKDGQLLKGLKIKQYADKACTTPSELGNYIAFSVPNVPNITIYQQKADESLKQIYRGSSGGVLYFLPARGSEPEQTLVFEYMNMDGTTVQDKINLNVQAALALDPEMALLAGYDVKKVWKWDAEGHCAWGNMGYNTGDTGEAVALNGAGQWWGIDFGENTFAGQTAHKGSDTTTGDDQEDSYMVITDEGVIECYAPEGGDPVRSGTVTITEYDPTAAWRKGWLNTDAIMWPYEINANGNIPGKYEIVYLTAEKMCLVYPDKGDTEAGGWSEASVWHFKAEDPHTIAAGTKLEGKKWVWNNDGPNGGVVWGNMGYCGGDGTKVYSGEGKWWGVTSTEEFAGQTGHKGADKITGDEDVEGAYMIWTEKEIQSFDKDGNMIRNGEYSFDSSVKNDWKKANLNIVSDNGAILWPYEINGEGRMPSTYEVVYLTEDAMTLVYPDKGDFGGVGGWGEASFWQFKAAKE